MVEDVSIDGEFFDEEFFSYREDADLAWRAQLMGWKCLYVPAAVGWHERRVTPERREQLPDEINWHSVKNRFLMWYKNIGWGLYGRTGLPVSWRNLMILGYAVLRKWMLFSAFFYPVLHGGSILRKRRIIQRKRRVSDRELARWFKWNPASEPFQKSEGASG
jgi:GT2 family glycosyltransferase